jgi:hypothetical protein
MRVATGIGIACGLCLGGGPAHASTDAGSGSLLDYAGVLVGASSFNLGGGLHPSFGLEAGTQVFSELGLGGFVSFAPSSATNSSDSSGTYTFAAVGDYFLDQLLPGARIGVKAGISCALGSVEPVFGPLAAYDYSLGSGLSIGGEASYLFATSQPLGESFHLLLTAHYWF